MLVTMAKVEMIGPKKFFDEAIALLQQLGTLHIDDLSKNKDALPISQMTIDPLTLESQNNFRELLTKVNSLISIYEPFEPSSAKEDIKIWHKDASYITKEVEKLLDELEEKTKSLANNKNTLTLEQVSLIRYQQALKKVYPLAKKTMAAENTETIAFILEGDFRDVITVIHDEIDKLTEGNFEIISNSIDDNTTAAIIFFNNKYTKKVHNFLSSEVNEINVSNDLKDLSIDSVLTEIEKKQKAIPDAIKKIDDQLKPLADSSYHQLLVFSKTLADKIDQIQSRLNFAQTDYTFVLHAWLPVDKLDNLMKSISERWGQKIIVRQLELTHHEYEEAPVVLNNPSWANRFQIFTQVFQSPKYGTIDPTIYLALFFPIFFGFIVGDMGYGMIIFTVATFLRFKFKDKKSEIIDAMTRILQIAGVSTIVFGAFFGEIFGDLLEKYLHHHHLVEKFQITIGPLTMPYGRNPEIPGRIMELLLISLAIGFIHLVISLIMGVINAVRENATKHMWEKIGALMFFMPIGIFLFSVVPNLLGSKLVIFPFLAIAPVKLTFAVVSILGAGLIGYGGGLVGAIEYTIGLIGNYFSYLRLMALGLAGVILAAVANSFVEKFGLIGLVMAIILHIINVVVHTITPAIHSFRLNLLEGFGKFYEEGGIIYKPFKARR